MTAQDIPRPRRSVLYVPSVNARAVEKAKGVDCDVVILDLEDSIAPDAKDEARATVLAILAQGGFGRREVGVRCNGLDTRWGEADLKAVAGSGAAFGAGSHPRGNPGYRAFGGPEGLRGAGLVVVLPAKPEPSLKVLFNTKFRLRQNDGL